MEFTLSAAPSVALFVRGLCGREDAHAFNSGWGESDDVRLSISARHVTTLALCDARARPLLGYEHTGQLDGHELHKLALAVVAGLNVISPAIWRCNIDAWKKTLTKGANHFTNVADMMAMAESGEPTYDLGTRHWRPDRYFGAALCELTDGQILAYDSAQIAYKGAIPKAKEKQWPKQKNPPSRL